MSKPYVLITIFGGNAEIAVNGGAEVDILDFDNLRDIAADDLRLSGREWVWLSVHDKELFEFFEPSYKKFLTVVFD